MVGNKVWVIWVETECNLVRDEGRRLKMASQIYGENAFVRPKKSINNIDEQWNSPPTAKIAEHSNRRSEFIWLQ